jgi:hypothetical protein
MGETDRKRRGKAEEGHLQPSVTQGERHLLRAATVADLPAPQFRITKRRTELGGEAYERNQEAVYAMLSSA